METSPSATASFFASGEPAAEGRNERVMEVKKNNNNKNEEGKDGGGLKGEKVEGGKKKSVAAL